MENWKEQIDNCAGDDMDKAFRVENAFLDRTELIADIQKEFGAGELTNAEFTASLMALANNQQELLYLVQLSGAQIFQTKMFQ